MATVNTVLGPIDTKDMGFTLTHEHCQASAPGITQDYPEFLGEGYIDRVVERLVEAKDEGGIDTIVDATTLDLGRDVNLLAEVSRRSGVNIIAVTGWWGDLHHFLTAVTVDQWAEVFIREIKEGIGGTGIKPGLLKAANDITGVTPTPHSVTDWAYVRMGETMLRAIARAHLATGIPIVVHSYPTNRIGLQQTAVLKEEGVDLRRVLVAHSNDTTDVEYLLMLLEQGCYLGMDRYPGDITYVSPQARTKTLKALIDAGYADHVLPSHDWPEVVPIPLAFMQAYNPHSFLYIQIVVIPQLREMGVTDETIKKMFVDGPRHFFEGV